MARTTVTLRWEARNFTVAIDRGRVSVDGNDVSIVPAGRGEFRIEGPRNTIAWAVASDGARWVFVEGSTYVLEATRPARPAARARAHHAALTSPMPATVRRVNVAPGDRVERGDTLLILEAMKMELPVKAGAAGTVRAVHCREGELVQPGTELLELDDADELAGPET